MNGCVRVTRAGAGEYRLHQVRFDYAPGSNRHEEITLVVVSLIGLTWAGGMAHAQPPGNPVVHRPGPGEYQHHWLTIAGGEPAHAFVGMRGDISTVARFVGDDIPGGVKKKTGTRRIVIDKHNLAVA